MMAGKLAIDDVSHFKAAIPNFAIDNPLATGRGIMAYFGARDFSHKRQIGVPLVVNTIKEGRVTNALHPLCRGYPGMSNRFWARSGRRNG